MLPTQMWYFPRMTQIERFVRAFSVALLTFGTVTLGAGAILVGCSGETEKPPIVCEVGKLACGNFCVDPMSAPGHCGSCGNACPAGSGCVQGACVLGADNINPACIAPQLSCSGQCTDPLQDDANCSGCGLGCPAGNVCDQGSCRAIGTQGCPLGRTLCDGSCVDLQASPNHCGFCGNFCPMGGCTLGQCSCPAGMTDCGGACVDTAADQFNCGGCGLACGEGEICTGSACVCAPGFTECPNGCADLLASATDCGMCGNACPGGQVCNAGTCECAVGETWCGDVCANLQSSAEHCSMCGSACPETQICNAGVCGCDVGQELCGEVCADVQTDNLNCGGCGIECVGGQTCQMGSCECPEGQTFCDGECIDTTSNDLNCGGCGMACGLGELCNNSMCIGGGLGEDGCQGIAEGLTLSGVSFYQTVEIPLMDDGGEVQNRNVDIVAGRQTLVRAFVEVGPDWSPRSLSGRVHLDTGEGRQTVYTAQPQTISGSSEYEDRDSTFEFMVDGELLTEDSSFALEIVECGAPPGLAVQTPRFPGQDGLDLNAVDAGGLRIHIVPLAANGYEPDLSEETLDHYRDGFMAMYPISDIEFTIGDIIEVGNPGDWNGNLEGLRALRDQENPDDDVYYYGMLRPSETIREFCGGGCTAGVGYVAQGGQFGGGASVRVSMGLAYPSGDGNSLVTMLHEVGHNHGRQHAPCGGPSGIDPQYPYSNAEIGVWGYSLPTDQLVPPNHPDIMAYCNDPWVSDYNYNAFLQTILSVNGSARSEIAPAERIGDFWVLLVDPDGSTRWGTPRIGPVVAQGVAEPAQVLDANGTVVETIDVYRFEVSDIKAYSIQVPAPQPDWHSIRISGAATTKF